MSYMPAGTISSALFLSLHVHKCTLLYQQLQRIFEVAMISAVSTCGRGRYRWQLRSEQSAYTMNFTHQISTYTLYITVVTPRWSCLERLTALPKAVQGCCQVHCLPLAFCGHLMCIMTHLWFIQLGAATTGCHDIHQSRCVCDSSCSAIHMPRGKSPSLHAYWRSPFTEYNQVSMCISTPAWPAH